MSKSVVHENKKSKGTFCLGLKGSGLFLVLTNNGSQCGLRSQGDLEPFLTLTYFCQKTKIIEPWSELQTPASRRSHQTLSLSELLIATLEII